MVKSELILSGHVLYYSISILLACIMQLKRQYTELLEYVKVIVWTPLSCGVSNVCAWRHSDVYYVMVNIFTAK